MKKKFGNPVLENHKSLVKRCKRKGIDIKGTMHLWLKGTLIVIKKSLD